MAHVLDLARWFGASYLSALNSDVDCHESLEEHMLYASYMLCLLRSQLSVGLQSMTCQV